MVSATTQLRILASNVEQRFSVKFDYKRISNPGRGFQAESAGKLHLNCFLNSAQNIYKLKKSRQKNFILEIVKSVGRRSKLEIAYFRL